MCGFLLYVNYRSMTWALKHIKMFVLCILVIHQSKKNKIIGQSFKNMNEGIISKEEILEYTCANCTWNTNKNSQCK